MYKSGFRFRSAWSKQREGPAPSLIKIYYTSQSYIFLVSRLLRDWNLKMDTRKGKKYTQTTIEAGAQLSTEEKSNTADSGRAPPKEEGTISLAMLHAELKNHFEIYREDMKMDIKAQIEIHCKEIRDDIASWRCQTESNMKSIRAEFAGRVDKLTAAQKEPAKTQDDMEKSLNDMSDRVVAFEKSYQVLVDDNKRLADKCSDLENRSRRQNIRIVGIGEGIEANDTNKFVARFLGEVLGEENFNRAILIDKAHRSLAPKPRIGEKPRSIIARLHYLSDKEKIMSLSRAKGKLSFEGSPVHIFPNVSPEVGRQRAAFNQVKAKLRSAGILYSMQFPAKACGNSGRHATRLQRSTIFESRTMNWYYAKTVFTCIHCSSNLTSPRWRCSLPMRNHVMSPIVI
uniref:L1 transposable element RRM domain-containing protein n=1 Tax=Oryzias latipes TaxID=8090 RepID=A0A3P9J4Q2_ORYLA